MLKLSVWFVLCMLVGIAVPSPTGLSVVDDPINDFDKKLQMFTNDILQNIREETPSDQSIVVSPLSLNYALFLLGCTADGKESREILTALHMESTDPWLLLNTYEKFLKTLLNDPVFLKIATKTFLPNGHGENKTLDFNSLEMLNFDDAQTLADTINDWMWTETKHQIHEIIRADSLNAQPRLVVANALYFQADWAAPFEADNTRPAPFYTVDGKREHRIDMMSGHHLVRYAELRELDAKVIELPYSLANTSMIVILPNTVDGLRTLAPFDLFAVRRMLREQPDSDRPMVRVRLPKFKVEFGINLENVLEKSGILTIFSNSSEIFRNFCSNLCPLSVPQLVHKTVIEVHEKGTNEAVAATGRPSGSSVTSEFDVPTVEFRADHPFIYAVVRNNTILFAGDYVGV